MPRPELSSLLGELRSLSTAYKAGDSDSFAAFRDLASKLLHLTIADSSSYLQLIGGPTGSDELLLTNGGEAPLLLNDGRFFRLSILLYRESTDRGVRMRVSESSFQYQEDQDGECWIFRYDYLRRPPEDIPGAHVQIRGSLLEDCLPRGTPLERIHFPTMRVSLEAVIRLLAKEFTVRCNEDDAVWKPALDETERAFFDIQHLPVGSPEPAPRSPGRRKLRRKK